MRILPRGGFSHMTSDELNKEIPYAQRFVIASGCGLAAIFALVLPRITLFADESALRSTCGFFLSFGILVATYDVHTLLANAKTVANKVQLNPERNIGCAERVHSLCKGTLLRPFWNCLSVQRYG